MTATLRDVDDIPQAARFAPLRYQFRKHDVAEGQSK